MQKNRNRPEYKKFTLGGIASFKSGGTPRKTNPAFWGGEYPWVSAKDLKHPVIFGSVDTLTDFGFEVAHVAPKGALLILVRGMTLHKRVPVCLAGKDMAFNQDLKALISIDEVFPKFLLYYLLAKESALLRLVDCAGHGTGRLSTDLLKRFPVLLPLLPEQKAIAGVLLTWDRAIEKTERLTKAKEKKFAWLLNKLINQGSEKSEWKKVKLGDAADIKKGSQRNRDSLDDIGDYPAMNGGIGPSGYTDEWNTEANTVTISEGGNSCGFVNYVAQKFWCGGHCYALVNLSAEMDKQYLYFYLKHHEPRLMRLRVGSGLPNIQKKDVHKFPVAYPLLSEQKRIAEILNTAQREIDLLKKLADKYKDQKRGLMQKLLTGEWRVKVEKGEVNEKTETVNG